MIVMKKYSLRILAVLAILNCFACKKDNGLVVFKASVEHASGGCKTTFEPNGGVYDIKWESGDKVNIWDGVRWTEFTTSNNDYTAEFVANTDNFNMDASTFKAVYPSSLVNGNGQLELPERQYYRSAANGRVYGFPMYAEAGSDHLKFKNLCGVLHLHLTGADLVKEIRICDISPNRKNLSGHFMVDDNGAAVVTDGAMGKEVVLDCGEGVTIDDGTGSDFYIVMPAGIYEKLRITVVGYLNRQYVMQSGSSVEIIRSKVSNANLELSISSIPSFLRLSDVRSQFASHAGCGTILFQYGVSCNDANRVSIEAGGPVKIYAVASRTGDTLLICTSATSIRLFPENPNCEWEGIFDDNVSHIDFGDGLITDDITNLARLFYGCLNLQTVNISCFNLKNVTSMRQMFGRCWNLRQVLMPHSNTANLTDMSGMCEGCSRLDTIDMSSFNTSGVLNMDSMFYDCSETKKVFLGPSFVVANSKTNMCLRLGSSAKPNTIIYCTEATENALRSGTGLNTNRVDFSRF